jgi:hypothetical protein
MNYVHKNELWEFCLCVGWGGGAVAKLENTPRSGVHFSALSSETLLFCILIIQIVFQHIKKRMVTNPCGVNIEGITKVPSPP